MPKTARLTHSIIRSCDNVWTDGQTRVVNETRRPTVIREMTSSVVSSGPPTAEETQADQSQSLASNSYFSPANHASQNVDGAAMLRAVNRIADVSIYFY